MFGKSSRGGGQFISGFVDYRFYVGREEVYKGWDLWGEIRNTKKRDDKTTLTERKETEGPKIQLNYLSLNKSFQVEFPVEETPRK